MEEAETKFPIEHEEGQGLPSPPRRTHWTLWKRWQHPSIDNEMALSSKHSSQSQLRCSTVQQLLVAVLGNNIEQDETDDNSSLQKETYFSFVKQKILTCPDDRFDKILENGFTRGASGVDGALTLMTKVADCTKMGYDFTIDKAIDKCIESGILTKSVGVSAERDKARIVIFNCISWISMLYPSLDKPMDNSTEESPDRASALLHSFVIDSTQCDPLIKYSQPFSNAELPICEVIQEFGSLLPVKRVINSEPQPVTDTVFSKDSLYVSLLNAKNLAQIGGVEFVWIEHVSSHLVFETDTMRPPRLFVYRFPSFCHLNRSHDSAFSRIVAEYYDNISKPPDFTGVAFMQEVLRSYRLLFGDDHRARLFYTKKEQKRAQENDMSDPYLDTVCAERASGRGAVRTSYNKATEFPILGDRLSIVQDYIQRQNPNTLKLLWRDRRNLLQWYTFWAVALIGGIGVVLALVQTGLGAGQVYYAAKGGNN